MAPTSKNASWSGCSLPSCANPSMVPICLPTQSPTCVVQDRVGLPSILTVQAPHRPSPQPYLLPHRSRSSRKTLRRLRAGAASMRCLVPLTWSSVTDVMGPPSGNSVLPTPFAPWIQTAWADLQYITTNDGNKPLWGVRDSLRKRLNVGDWHMSRRGRSRQGGFTPARPRGYRTRRKRGTADRWSKIGFPVEAGRPSHSSRHYPPAAGERPRNSPASSGSPIRWNRGNPRSLAHALGSRNGLGCRLYRLRVD